MKKILLTAALLLLSPLTFANSLTLWHATWCHNCPGVIEEIQTPAVQQALKSTHTTLRVVDIDQHPNRAIYGVPTLQLKDNNGRVIGELAGAVGAEKIIQLIEEEGK